jgi:hypothetical protein
VLNAYLPVLCGVCEDDWAQRRTVHPHGFCGIIPERIFIESQKKNLFYVFVSSFFLSGIGFYCCVPRVFIRMIRSKNCVGSSLDADQFFVFFSLLFFYFDFLFVLESFIIQFSHFSLSLSLTLSSSYLLHPTSTILLPPAPFHPSAPYIKYNKTSKILNKINNN